jgi:spore coat polysaccharide biosynthesis protein SpsF
MTQGKIIDEMLCEYLKNGYNGFMGNNELVSPNPYPDGTDIEIFPYWMLAETWQLTQNPYHREHVTPFMYRRGTQYHIHSFLNQRPNTRIINNGLHFSFDTQKDYELITKIAKNYDISGNLDAAIKAIV